MFRVLITDASYKHAIALARYIKSVLPETLLIGHDTNHSRFAGWHDCFDEMIKVPSLETALKSAAFDMVIPVGAGSVMTVAYACSERAVLPPSEALTVAFDKNHSVQLAKTLDVPVPETRLLSSSTSPTELPISFPCVVKPLQEGAGFKGVSYCGDRLELSRAVAFQRSRLPASCDLVVQEFIGGHGCGLFALFDNGRPLRLFMHRRIREYPPTGGASTAAQAFYSPRLKELGLRLLKALRWHGVAMVEFKYCEERRDFVLMEINGKFWGSLELALSAGVNFGADLIRLFRGETLTYSEDYDRDCEFYWPLDGDLLTLMKTNSLRRISDYWRPKARTNLHQSIRADATKLLRLLGKAVTESAFAPRETRRSQRTFRAIRFRDNAETTSAVD